MPISFVWLPPLAAFTSALIVTSLVPVLDPRKSIASIRRIFSLFFVSTLIWILPSAIGVIVNHSQSGASEFIFGAFLVWAFELIVINGAFLSSTAKSAILGAIHPALVVLTVTEYHENYIYSAVLGLVVLSSAILFLHSLKTVRTRTRIDSITLLQAFLRTWVEREPRSLEACFMTYAKVEPVQTEVILARAGTRDLSIVVPGIHPGPFAPVGSYNLSELIYRTLRSTKTTPVVLHGTGGHERNVPTNELAVKHAQLISQLVASLEVASEGRMKGPLQSTVGITNVTTMIFGTTVLAIISSAPFTTDDLDPATIIDATKAASELGLTLCTIDAHNAIGGITRAQELISKDSWRRILINTLSIEDRPLALGFAQAAGTDFNHGRDISDGGMSAILLSTGDWEGVLVTADSNNAVSGLREALANTIEGMGLKFIELCTSDTHAFAARNITQRGYFALGEDTKVADITATVKELASRAKASAAPCSISISTFETTTSLIGRESLDDFATLTSNAVSIAKTYVEVAVPTIVLFMFVILFY